MGFLLPALVALIPLLIAPGLLFHYDSAPKVALLVLAMSLALARPGRVAREVAELWRQKSGKWLCLAAGAQILWSAFATTISSRPLFSLFGSNWRRLGFLTILALSLFVVLSAAHLLRKPGQTGRVLRAMALAGIALSCYGIAQYFNLDPFQNAAGYHAQDGDFTIVRPPSTLGHADYFGWWLSITVFCTWGLFRVEHGLWRWLALASTTLSAIAMVLSGTRSAIAAAGFSLLFLIFTSRVRLRSRHLISALAIAGAFLVFYESPAGAGLRARARWSADETIGGARPLLWRDSLRMAASHPFTGFGPETFAAEFPRYQSVKLARLAPDFYHESPHNVAMDELTNEGIPGLLIALGWAVIGGYTVLRAHEKNSPLNAALAAAFVASCIASLFNAMTIGPAIATLAVIAMLVAKDGESAQDGRSGRESSRFSRGIALTAALPVAAALAAFGVLLTISDFRLERFNRLSSEQHRDLAVAAYNTLRESNLQGAAEDLYCSRRLADDCGAGGFSIARLECARIATQAAARATATADNPPNAWYNLAMFAAAQNDGRGTEKELRKAVALAPNWFRPHWALANFLARMGRHADAVGEIERAALLDAGRNEEVINSLRQIEKSH